MSKITINEIDNTVRRLDTLPSDNIVFVPGNASDGAEGYHLVGNYDQFVSELGPRPAGDDTEMLSSYDYAANLLLAGFPVLYYRVIPGMEYTGDFEPDENTVEAATAKHTITLGQEAQQYEITFEYKNPGTNGNNYSYTIYVSTSFASDTTVYLRVYKAASLSYSSTGLKLIESIPLCTKFASEDYDDPESNAELLPRIVNGLRNATSQYINVTVPDEIVTIPAEELNVNHALSGGLDPDYNSIKNTILGLDSNHSIYYRLQDKFLYDVKFVTSGCYYDENSSGENSFTRQMLGIAEIRKDCVAIIDSPPTTEVETILSFLVGFNTSYGTSFAPWGKLNLLDGTQKWCNPSFIFLFKLAKSLARGNSIWLPPAGIRRATVTEMVDAKITVGQLMSEDWQSGDMQYINPIVYMYNYGYVIFGQKTLYTYPEEYAKGSAQSALSELSVRMIANEIKRLIYDAALNLTFEQNNLHTWNEFRSRVTPTLTGMRVNGALYGYQVILNEETTTDEDINENRIRATIRVSIARAVEDFDIDFVLEPAGVTFEDEDE